MPVYNFLTLAPQGEHVIQFFDDKPRMLDNACLYISAGIHQGEGVFVLSTHEHFKKLCDECKVHDSAQLEFVDSLATIQFIRKGGAIDRQRFKHVVSQPIQRLRDRFGKVRVWGGLVNVLWESGDKEAALACEEYWNEVLQEIPFFLYHTYVTDPLADVDFVKKLCGKHTFSASGQPLKLSK